MSSTQGPHSGDQRIGTVVSAMARALLSGENAPDYPSEMSNNAAGVRKRGITFSFPVILSSGLLVIIVIAIVLLVRVFSPSNSTARTAATTPPTAPGSSAAGPVSMPSLVLSPSKPLTIVSVFGGTGTTSLLSSPEEAVVTHSGRVFVADTLNRRIAVFDQQGKLVQSITKGPGGPLVAPFAISLLPNGDPIVLDSELGQLIEYNLQGKVMRSSSPALGLVHARGFAVSTAGQIVVANTPGNAIDLLDRSFTITRRVVGQPAGRPLDFNQPTTAAYGQDGSIYVLDCQNNRIIRYTRDWQKLQVLPVATTDTLHSPRLLVLPDGRVLATDPRDSALLIFAPHTTQPRVYSLGTGRVPLGIALDGPSKLLITCSGSNQVLIANIPRP